MDDDAQPAWVSWLKSPWAWPLPAVLAHLAVLLLSSRVWTERSMSRHGTMAPAHGELAVLVAASLVYAATLLAPDLLFVGVRGVREPTDAERGCALVLLKALCLLGLYGSAYAFVSHYLFGS